MAEINCLATGLQTGSQFLNPMLEFFFILWLTLKTGGGNVGNDHNFNLGLGSMLTLKALHKAFKSLS